jgi:hypothetical protein
LPHTYEEVWIDPACLDLEREFRRQRAVWRAWRARLPANCRKFVPAPEPAKPLAFSRLTLEGQLEVLARNPEETWRLCAQWNPLLRKWKPLAAAGALEIADWPETADRELGGAAYAERFLAALRTGAEVEPGASERAQADFLRQRLGAPFLIPLLMS